jgi:hypothetical protein
MGDVRTGQRPLPRSLRRLLPGYAGAFHRRSQRVGPLVQHRSTSLMGEEAPSRLALIRSLPLNPVRMMLLPDRRMLDRFPWTGQGALLGTVPRPGQDTAPILAPFGSTRRRARRASRACVAAGVSQGRPPDWQGGGLLRALGGWPAIARARAGIASRWPAVLGHPGRPLAPMLGVHPAVVSPAARRGAPHAATSPALLTATHTAP